MVFKQCILIMVSEKLCKHNIEERRKLQTTISKSIGNYINYLGWGITTNLSEKLSSQLFTQNHMEQHWLFGCSPLTGISAARISAATTAAKWYWLHGTNYIPCSEKQPQTYRIVIKSVN